jgi:hypothetical protein
MKRCPTEPGDDDSAGILFSSAIIFLVQGMVWLLGLFFATTLQLELLYPYVTVSVLAWLCIIPALNFALAGWSGLLAFIARGSKRYPRYQKLETNLFALCSWIAIPFGPIINAWRRTSGREKGVDQDPRTGSKDILVASLAMFYATGSIIAVLLIGIPIILDASIIDLAYPYITPRMLPWFIAIGIYYVVLAVGDVFLSILYKAKQIDLFAAVPSNGKIASLGRGWLIAHLIALPIGPFLAALAVGAIKKEK